MTVSRVPRRLQKSADTNNRPQQNILDKAYTPEIASPIDLVGAEILGSALFCNPREYGVHKIRCYPTLVFLPDGSLSYEAPRYLLGIAMASHRYSQF